MVPNNNPPTAHEPGSIIGTATTGAADRVLDITAETCPMTFVRTRLALDAMAPGQVLLVKLRGAEPRERVPATARMLGHAVLRQDEQPDGTAWVWLRHG